MSVMSGGTAPKGFRAGGSRSASAGSAGTVMTFSTFHSSPSRNQRQTEAEVLGGDHDADEAPGRLRVVRRADLQGYLVLGAEVDALHVLTRGEVPEVDRVPVLLAQQQLRHDPVLDHRRTAPLAGDQHVLVEVPPGVVVEVLRPAVGLPGAQDVE